MEFVQYMAKYNKTYATEDEKRKRFEQFKISKKQVETINSIPGHSMSHVNIDADMFDEEWAARF